MGKPILIVTYYWPPSGGSAVQRWLSFANELSALGHEVHVLTVKPELATYQLFDETLVSDIYPSIQVHTTKTNEPFTLYKKFFGQNSIPAPAFANETSPSLLKKLARAIRGNLFIPDPRKGWIPFAVPAAIKILKQYHITTVITAGPPHSTHFIGLTLQKAKGVKWIADFHDLWTDVIYYKMLYHLPVVKSRDKKLEKKILEEADLVITVGEKYKQKLLSKSNAFKSDKIKILPIGYDDKLFQNIRPSSIDPGILIITYTGSIADFYQPQVLIDAVANLPEELKETVRLQFVGVLSKGISDYIKQKGLGNQFLEVGYVPHKVAVQYLFNSDALLLVNPVTENEAMVIPGKIYEYLAAQKTIINITDLDAETAGIIQACNAGRTFTRNQKEELCAWLIQLVEEKRDGLQKTPDNKSLVERYSRKNEAAVLSQWL